MKAILTLLFLFVGLYSFADDVRIDPSLVNEATYVGKVDSSLIDEAIYNGELDPANIIQVQNFSGGTMETCTRHTAVGVHCYCNHGIMRGRQHINELGWHADERQHAVRDGWHVTYIKGMHSGGISCMRDRGPTPEERARASR